MSPEDEDRAAQQRRRPLATIAATASLLLTTTVGGIALRHNLTSPTNSVSGTSPPPSSSPSTVRKRERRNLKEERWYPHQDSNGNRFCIHNADYPNDWATTSSGSQLLFDTETECCTAFHLSCADDAAATTTKEPYWYPHQDESGNRRCAYDADYDDSFLNTKNGATQFLFDQEADCCAAFGLTACGTTALKKKWYPIEVDNGLGNGGVLSECVYDDQYPPEYLAEGMAEIVLFDTKERCCDSYGCTTQEYWYYPKLVDNTPSCVYGNDYPPSYVGSPSPMLYETLEKCCDAYPVVKGGDCTAIRLANFGGVAVLATVPASLAVDTTANTDATIMASSQGPDSESPKTTTETTATMADSTTTTTDPAPEFEPLGTMTTTLATMADSTTTTTDPMRDFEPFETMTTTSATMADSATTTTDPTPEFQPLETTTTTVTMADSTTTTTATTTDPAPEFDPLEATTTAAATMADSTRTTTDEAPDFDPSETTTTTATTMVNSTTTSTDPAPGPITPPWGFTVLADLHSFGLYSGNFETYKNIASNIQQNYGGGYLLLTPGDNVSWGGKTNAQIQEVAEKRSLVKEGATENEAIYRAALYSYNLAKEVFHQGGFDLWLPTVGDHEIGGNEGFRVGTKLKSISSYRQGFIDGSMKENPADDNYTLFTEDIDGVPSRPLGTPFEGTSFAYRHRNALFISVDAFRTVNNGVSNYIDRENGFGGEGAITCDLDGKHLTWFENILMAAKANPDIKHIFVEAHLPIQQPVRKVRCSGQFLDGEDESPFWLLMNQYGVDVYFAGEVHSNTVSKTKVANSNLIQIVSRGNGFDGFLTVHVQDDSIEIKHFNEFGPMDKHNNNYVQDGILRISKADPKNVAIESSGELLILDNEIALIEFDFEAIVPIGTRQVHSLDGNSVVMGGVTCTESLHNIGSFGAQYDAQVANLNIHSPGRDGSGHAGEFSGYTLVGIYGYGPLTSGEIVSLQMWIKTSVVDNEMILASYCENWGYLNPYKDILLLTLDKGIPTFYVRPGESHKAIIDPLNGDWHHIALTMPRKSCRSSEMILYVDQERVDLKSSVSGNQDRYIFFSTQGQMAFGGWGYATGAKKKYFSDMVNYVP